MTTNPGFIFRSGRVCCVAGCSNSEYRNTDLRYYTFPGRKYEIDRKRRWIEAVRETMPNKSWTPNVNSRICSMHFAGGKKSTIQKDEAYVPTIFPGIPKANRLAKVDPATRSTEHPEAAASIPVPRDPFAEEEPMAVDDIRKSGNAKVALQKVHNEKKIRAGPNGLYGLNRQYEALAETGQFIKQEVEEVQIKQEEELEIDDPELGSITEAYRADIGRNPGFLGISGVASDAILRQLAGVSPETFSTILKLVECAEYRAPAAYTKLKKENAMLLFLMKIKFGLGFSILDATFHIRAKTASSIFFHILKMLTERTESCIFWPAEESGSKDNYPSIACVEIPLETPTTIDQRILMYSSRNESFTAKFLMAITPDGIICKVSKVYGARVANSIIANDCGFLNFTEDQLVDDSIASVRIEVGRALERVKNRRVLRYVSAELLPYLESIMHICCIFANSQTALTD